MAGQSSTGKNIGFGLGDQFHTEEATKAAKLPKVDVENKNKSPGNQGSNVVQILSFVSRNGGTHLQSHLLGGMGRTAAN